MELSDDSETSEYDTDDEYQISYDEYDILYINERKALKRKQQGVYFIGLCNCISFIDDSSQFILSHVTTPTTFFKHSYEFVLEYLWEYSIMRDVINDSLKIHIMKLNIVGGCYYAIIKTHWIRLIQRHWKKTFRLRYSTQLKRGSIYAQNYFAIRGRYPTALPTIHGMLSAYRKHGLTSNSNFVET